MRKLLKSNLNDGESTNEQPETVKFSGFYFAKSVVLLFSPDKYGERKERKRRNQKNAKWKTLGLCLGNI